MATLLLFKFRTLFLLTLVYAYVSIGLCAEKEVFFFGGGGEPSGPSTIFENDIRLVSKFTNGEKTDWKSSYSFNGGHSQTEINLEQSLSKSTSMGSFTEKNFEKALTDLENKISSGKLKAGDQLLLIMNSHGAVQKPGEKTHSISLSGGSAEDMKNLKGASLFNMDRLSKLTTLASNKGIKLAIMDLSCFSGSSIKLANKNTCVITASGDKQYSYSDRVDADGNTPNYTFGSRLILGMKKGSNLEDIFLNARNGGEYPDFPMISTDSGILVNKLLYDLITPYLVNNNGSALDFDASYDFKNAKLDACDKEEQYSEILLRIDEITRLANISKKILDSGALKKALQDYRQQQIEFENALLNTREAAKEVRMILSRDHSKYAYLFDGEDGLSIVSNNREEALSFYKKSLREAKESDEKAKLKRIVDTILLKDKISGIIALKMSANSKISVNEFNKVSYDENKTFYLAGAVSREARKFYDKLYKLNASKTTASNPCKDFVL